MTVLQPGPDADEIGQDSDHIALSDLPIFVSDSDGITNQAPYAPPRPRFDLTQIDPHRVASARPEGSTPGQYAGTPSAQAPQSEHYAGASSSQVRQSEQGTRTPILPAPQPGTNTGVPTSQGQPIPLMPVPERTSSDPRLAPPDPLVPYSSNSSSLSSSTWSEPPLLPNASLPISHIPAITTVTSITEIGWVNDQALIDWAAVAEMRRAASTRLSNQIGSNQLDTEHQHNLGRSIIADLLSERAQLAITSGRTPWDATTQARIGQAVFDALFRLGRLQPLVDDDSIENIIIAGADNVWIESADGRLTAGPPVADSDQELIDFLSFIASRSEVNERSFSQAEPRLHLRLDSGARLAAAAWVTPRPSVVIRRHRLQDVTLSDLVARRTLSDQTARFLAEAVRRRASIVVSGTQGAGKTTLMRALCAEIPPDEVIGTFETEYELHLHQMPKQHQVVHAWEARPGSGELDASGRRSGEFLLDDALYDSFRFNLSRQIVGEVRGPEILAMLKAMQSGSGSLSTTHASSAEAAVRKLITCALEAGPHVTSTYAARAIAEAIDFIVHMEMVTERRAGKVRRHRWIKEILSVAPSDSGRGYATTRVFSTLPGEGLAALEVVPDGYLDVFDPVEEMWKMTWP